MIYIFFNIQIFFFSSSNIQKWSTVDFVNFDIPHYKDQHKNKPVFDMLLVLIPYVLWSHNPSVNLRLEVIPRKTKKKGKIPLNLNLLKRNRKSNSDIRSLNTYVFSLEKPRRAPASHLERGANIWKEKCRPPWLGEEENYSLFTPSKHPKTI